MIARFLLLASLWAAALAQDKPDKPNVGAAPGSVAGTVTDAGTGTPLPEVQVFANRGSNNEKQAVTDAQGHYAIRELDMGQYNITAQALSPRGRGPGPYASRRVNLGAGQDLATIDFHLVAFGSISGKVRDQNNEPVPGLQVSLIAREYTAGALRLVFAGAGQTDDRGDYHLDRVAAGRAFYVLAQRRADQLDAISNAPLDPKLRRPAVIPTYYPNGANMENGQALVLRPGEYRDGMDIKLVRTPALCVEAVLEGSAGPSDLRFTIAEGQPHSGASGDGAVYIMSPHGTAGADGRVRICGLHPGQYELTASEYAADTVSISRSSGAMVTSLFTTLPVTLGDEDVRGLRVIAQPRLNVPGEVVWDGPAPVDPPSAQLNISAQPISRTGDSRSFEGVNAQLPGEFTMAGMLADEYSLRFTRVPAGVYVKDVTYDGHSIWNRTLRPGSATSPDARLRVLVARDGGTVTARVTDKDGNPVGDTTVVVMPAAADSEAMLAASMVTGKTDQFGAYKSSTLPPGKYYVAAPATAVDKSPESIARLWRARSTVTEVEVPPNGSGSAALTPKTLE